MESPLVLNAVLGSVRIFYDILTFFGMDKYVVCIQKTQYYSLTIKKDIQPFVTTWGDLEDIMLSEVSQT